MQVHYITQTYENADGQEVKSDNPSNLLQKERKRRFGRVSLIEGFDVPSELVPKSGVFVKGAKKYAGWASSGEGACLVDDRVKELIENIEPGVHRFHPFALRLPDGTPMRGPHYLLNCCTRVDAVDPERSEVTRRGEDGINPKNGRPKYWGYDLITLQQPKMKLVLRREVVEGRAMWFDHRLGALFFADPIVQGMRSQDVKGFKIKRTADIA